MKRYVRKRRSPRAATKDRRPHMPKAMKPAFVVPLRGSLSAFCLGRSRDSVPCSMAVVWRRRMARIKPDMALSWGVRLHRRFGHDPEEELTPFNFQVKGI